MTGDKKDKKVEWPQDLKVKDNQIFESSKNPGVNFNNIEQAAFVQVDLHIDLIRG